MRTDNRVTFRRETEQRQPARALPPEHGTVPGDAVLRRSLLLPVRAVSGPRRPRQNQCGRTAVVSVELDQPSFQGSTHGQLGNSDVRLCVAEAVREHLCNWFEEHPEQAAEFVGRLLRAGRQD
ncbi:hypothetical protein [Streptomyces sp. NPDC058739]|uniref:hypothetical protein n=1 Tax=Streptomyces sp. NPDC058739 TaxID=3346618 RepID=UPI0036ABD484